MDATLTERAKRFCAARQQAAAVFRGASPMMHALSAYIVCLYESSPDAEQLRQTRKLYKQETSPFSSFRGAAMPALITKLSLSPEPTKHLESVKAAFLELKNAGFWPSDYLVWAASLLSTSEANDHAYTVKAREIWLDMRRVHRLLSSSDDVCFAVMLAMYIDSVSDCLTRTEAAYAALRERFGGLNVAQAMSHVLAMGSDVEAGARRSIAIFDALRADGLRCGRTAGLIMLAALSLLIADDETDKTACDLVELDAALHGEKGFSNFKVGKDQRLLYAAALLAQEKLKTRVTEPQQAKKMLELIELSMALAVTNAVIQASAGAS